MLVRLWSKSIAWLKYGWAREPVIFMSCVFGFSGPAFALVSPWCKDTVITMQSIPHCYPYPQLDNEDMSDVDTEGNRIKPIFPPQFPPYHKKDA